MATKKSASHNTKTGSKGADTVRDRVRELSVSAFRDRKLSMRDVPKLVHEVLGGAAKAVDDSIPESKKSVLREVFTGLSEGVNAIASAGSATVHDVRKRVPAAAGKNASDTAKRIRAANDDFLGAVRSFAGKTSKQVREELHTLVARAERTSPKVAESARKAAKAADGRLFELTSETANAGAHVVRRAAGALAMGAGGLLEGIAEAIAPQKRPNATKPSKSTPPKKTKKASPRKVASKRRKA